MEIIESHLNLHKIKPENRRPKIEDTIRRIFGQVRFEEDLKLLFTIPKPESLFFDYEKNSEIMSFRTICLDNHKSSRILAQDDKEIDIIIKCCIDNILLRHWYRDFYCRKYFDQDSSKLKIIEFSLTNHPPQKSTLSINELKLRVKPDDLFYHFTVCDSDERDPNNNLMWDEDEYGELSY
jgi:hypothetical protein